MEGAARAAEATTADTVSPALDPKLEQRGRLLRQAVATVVEALGEQSTYRRHVQKWMDRLDPAARALVALPTAVRMAGKRLPANPPGLIQAHKAFVRTVDHLRKNFRLAAPVAQRRPLTRHDSLSAAVQACTPRARFLDPPVLRACECGVSDFVRVAFCLLPSAFCLCLLPSASSPALCVRAVL